MNEISRPRVPGSTQWVMRILERPQLAAAVRELPGRVLAKLIDRVGLEDAGELVALASTAQLERVFDDDLWRADPPGGDETFRPERFALWLRVMAEAGDEALVQRLCELPRDLVALAVHRLVLVLDLDFLEEQLSPGDDEAAELERALEHSAFEEWEELRVIARDPDAWDDVWGALMALDRDHHDVLRALLERCCEMTRELISGQGGLYQVLTADEMLDSDVAAGRDDRRAAEGFVSPADARAFLALARQGGGEERDAITHAYFRALTPAPASQHPELTGNPRAERSEAHELAALLQEVEVTTPPARLGAFLPATVDVMPERSRRFAPLFEDALEHLRAGHPDRFAERVRELGYLVNVWLAGGSHDGRAPKPAEAIEVVLTMCEAGLRAHLGADAATGESAGALLASTPADLLFRRGFRSR